MTDAEMMDLVLKARGIAAAVGPQHAYWDMIFDAEAILSHRRSTLDRATIEQELTDAVGPGRGYRRAATLG